MKNVTDILVRTLKTADANHVEGLVQREGRGSFVPGIDTQAKLVRFFDDLEFREIPHNELPEGSALDICTYYRFDMPEDAGALQAITDLGTLLRQVEPGKELNVTVRRSLHDDTIQGRRVPALEISHNDPKLKMYKPVNFGFVIVGPTDDGDAIWTWHPGSLTAAPTPVIDAIIKGIVVKL